MSHQKNPDQLDRKRSLFFLIGLCISLGTVYGLFHYKSFKRGLIIPMSKEIPLDNSSIIPVTHRNQEQPPEQKQENKKVEKKIVSELIKIIGNDDWKPSDENWKLDDIPDFRIDDSRLDTITFNIEALDKKPIFPGCEDLLSEEDRFKCFQQKLAVYVANNYKPCQTTLGVTKEKLYIKFVIDEFGKTKNAVVIRGLDDCNMQKAVQMVSNLPEMIPGVYLDKKVRTSFVLPINIK